MKKRTPQTQEPKIFGKTHISIEDIMHIAKQHQRVALNQEQAFIDTIHQGPAFLDKLMREDGMIYGVTTGYGDSCTIPIPLHLVDELSTQLVHFHGCGLGRHFSPTQARAILAVRLCSLSQGVSGVRLALLEQLVTLLNHDIAPMIPEEGSVGASGDLTPLSYVAATLMGKGTVTYQGQHIKTADIFQALQIKPLHLKPKEGLAIMNGTAVMTALACEAYHRTAYLCQLAARLTAMASIALQGNAFHFDERLFALKPHPGQMQIAAWIREDLAHDTMPRNSARLQDRYSLRCAPHIIGVVQDSLPWFRQLIETELNSANDNPLVDAEHEHILHGGHFYGGHIATVMDTMKCQVANLADLLDRQMAMLTDPKFNHGLPANLSGATGERAVMNHGFKAVHIAMSAWTAEALKHTMPASVFSRSTECHNQDKVSMGTIAARDCLRVLELTEQVFAAHLLATTQAIQLRLQMGTILPTQLSENIRRMTQDILETFHVVQEDRPLADELGTFMSYIQTQRWSLYPCA